MDTSWKPGGSKIDKKLESTLISDGAAASSSEDKSTTAGCGRQAFWQNLGMIGHFFGVVKKSRRTRF